MNEKICSWGLHFYLFWVIVIETKLISYIWYLNNDVPKAILGHFLFFGREREENYE